MSTPMLIGVTAAITALTAAVLTAAARINGRRNTLRARRSAGILQLLRWFLMICGLAAIAVEALLSAGIQTSTLIVVLGGLITATAFAVREPISDFLTAAMLLLERTAAIGDEVELNGEIVGQLAGFGLRSVTLITWDGDVVYVAASTIRTLRNVSKGASRAVVDIDVPATIPTGRAAQVLSVACMHATDDTFRSQPEVLGVVEQHLDRYVMRVTCMIDPAGHREAGYRLKAAAADAVAGLLNSPEYDGLDTEQMLRVVPQVVGHVKM
ncbi:MAG TPA: mechanosensitive ion channel domain-containing protein [Ilumatobacter sp.]|nr:mechanosensitive ion channel domain-containing protein [Ilumatobacter sp.]